MIRKLCILGLFWAQTAVFAGPKPAPAIPTTLRDMIKAPLWPMMVKDPTAEKVLYLERAPMVPLELLAAPDLGLAGVQVDPQIWSTKRRTIYTNPSIFSLEKRQTITIRIPEDRHVETVRFSPNGRWLALSVDAQNGVEIWLADAQTGAARRLEKHYLNDTMIQVPFQWSADSRTLFVATREKFQEGLKVPLLEGVTIEEAEGTKVPARTYAHLLRTAADQKLFHKVAQVQLVAVDVKTLRTKRIGPVLPLQSFALAPNGEHVLLESYAKPYSLAVPARLFARDVQVLSLKKGSLQKVLQMPLAETIPPEGERIGPRDVQWQLDHPARLLWWEALDDGDPRKKVDHRDRLMSWDLPFIGKPVEHLRTENRAISVNFLPRADQILVRDYNPDTHRSLVDFADLKTRERRRLLDYQTTDDYNHPGRIHLTQDADGHYRVFMDQDRLFLSGDGDSPKGERPFLDAMDIKTGKTTRLFQSPADTPYIEEFSFMIGHQPHRLAVSRQAAVEPPNLWLHDLRTTQSEALTQFVDNVPAMTRAQKQPLVYQRKDGITLSGTLYLPHDYVPGTKLPAMVWAYPEEFRSKDVAGQVRVSDKRYSRPSPIGVEWLVTQGYAVLTQAAMPVVGDKETVNNTFVQQIVSNAEAAIDALDKRGVVDRKRVAIGGHSYGAFMTANLLAHSDLFCAGVARSGAYNRSLTPFGFQAERRTFWEAKDFYMMVSPFATADQIKTPLLLIHGKNDNNPGTAPMQTERMFQAIRGVGGTARLVMLPYESHGYRAQENVELVQSETLGWLNRNCGPIKATAKR
ncbi:S9 family peptidase [Oligoflexus tunisiensis]|uniref:S9 family peptidase n=1 Tax=Oligoflexus tunisiensis TaxID=708132 RepID=UPI000A72BE06|nr:prolyl oligopeptidase family serine peptidase [Oligoflexus tunisiensis]